MANEEDQRIANVFRRAIAYINDTQAEVEFTASQLLEGDDAVNFLKALMSTCNRVESGQISAEQGLHVIEEWTVPEEKP